MKFKPHHNHPAQLWYEANNKDWRIRLEVYRKHEAHVIEYRTSPIGRKLRRYQSKSDHEAHVKVWLKLVKRAVRNTCVKSIDKVEGFEDHCLVFTGALKRTGDTPRCYVGSNAHSTTRLFHEQMLGKGYEPGTAWVNMCGNRWCVIHRERMTQAEKNGRMHIPTAVRSKAMKVSARARSPYTREDVERVIQLKREGHTYSSIFSLTGIPRSTAWQFVSGKHWGDVDPVKRSGIAFMAAQLGA